MPLSPAGLMCRYFDIVHVSTQKADKYRDKETVESGLASNIQIFAEAGLEKSDAIGLRLRFDAHYVSAMT